MVDTASLRVLLCYDGSVPAGAAIEVAAHLLPGARADVTYMWTPPFASQAMRRRLWHGSAEINEFVAAIEREGEAEAGRLAAMGVAVARACGWAAEPLIHQSYGGEGLQIGEVAETVDADLIVLGSRGLSGASAVLGSVSDMAVHYAPRPVLVVPYPLLTAERAALDKGPALMAWDASLGAETAWRAAGRLFPARDLLPVHVRDGLVASPTISGLVEIQPVGGHLEPGRAIAGALADQAGIEHAALVVVGSQGHTALREILLGSTAMAVLHHAHRPVLVVPHRVAGEQ